MCQRKGRKRLAMDIPEDIHKILHEIAFDRNTTITKYVLVTIVDRLKIETGYDKKL